MDLQNEISDVGTDVPVVSVVLNTFNRREGLERALRAVLAQNHPAFEVVVVDDGSTDGTAELLETIDDPRVTVVNQANAGLGASRRIGAESASGRWLVFLDDDDCPLDGWLTALTARDSDSDVGAVCIGARYVRPDGSELHLAQPDSLGPLFSNWNGLFVAGSFALRREIYSEAGGYLPGMMNAHQTELAIRAVSVMKEHGKRIETAREPLIEIEHRDVNDRPMSSAAVHWNGTRWILARHHHLFASNRPDRARFRGIAGIAGVRMGDLRDAKSYLWGAVLDQPRNVRNWLRAVIVQSPPLARRVWGTGNHSGRNIEQVARLQARYGGPDLLFLPWGYRENQPNSSDADDTPFWKDGIKANDVRYQDPLYRAAARLVRRRGITSVIDIGCGSGHKLVKHIVPVTRQCLGVDQASGIQLAKELYPKEEWIAGDLMADDLWKRLDVNRAQLVICADVVEHVSDPYRLLSGIRSLLRNDSLALVSTPDRSRIPGADQLGPPGNPRHIREWSMDEFTLLVEAAGFTVVRKFHSLPRAYSANLPEVKRTVHRALHGSAVPDRRYAMAFLLRASQRV